MEIPNIFFLGANRVWRTYPGGMTLDKMEKVESPKDSHFPEDWIGSTTLASNKGREHLTEEGLSKVMVAEKPVTLKELFEKEPEALLGKQHFEKYGANTQFLLKFLDAAVRLHIQCHPTIPFAQKYLNSNSGKTEAYVILDIREDIKDPYIYMGFQNPPSKEDFKTMIEEQDSEAILSCFEKIKIKPGDVFMVPGGMPHAIGEGVFMVEIMEPTDFAVRIEFERGGYVLPEEARFMNRGIDFALSMFNYDPTPVDKVKEQFFCKPQLLEKQNQSTESVLIDEQKTKCFRVNRINVKDAYVKVEDAFYIGIVTMGSGTIKMESGEVFNVKKGDKFFVPYQTDKVWYTSEKEMEVVITFPPE
ncbi:class I mannose-6-phosphate isomerase [Flavobacteriaceae bacterium MHTCC 0001]